VPTVLKNQIKMNYMLCGKCGIENKDIDKFCRECGTKLNHNNKLIVKEG